MSWAARPRGSRLGPLYPGGTGDRRAIHQGVHCPARRPVLLGIALGVKKGKLCETEISTLKAFLLELPRTIEQALLTDRSVREVARTLVDARSILYLGRASITPLLSKAR